MPFKEGVDEERVQWFRQLVAAARDLDSQIDSGAITPDEAFEKLDEAMDSMTKPAKPEKYGPETDATTEKKAAKAVGTKSAA